MRNIFIINLEPVDTRYTAQWKTHIPEMLEKHIADNKLDYQVIDIDGIIEGDDTGVTPGAFLDFAKTNIYKSSQAITVAKLFEESLVQNGDHFLFTDAWNPTIIQLKYMAELLGKKITIHALWHAGSYDPADWLGRHFNKAWSYPFEQSLFWAIDRNYYASQFHMKLFVYELFNVKSSIAKLDSMLMRLNNKMVRTGWPMDYMPTLLEPYKNTEKEDIILFPHRLAPEKQLNIFKDLADALPQYQWIVCQEQKRTKDEYHELLGKAKMIFSANLQETLGISMYEGALVGALPVVPDRLSYTEMWPTEFKYPQAWTQTFEDYLANKDRLVTLITQYMTDYETYATLLPDIAKNVGNTFFTANELINEIFK